MPSDILILVEKTTNYIANFTYHFSNVVLKLLGGKTIDVYTNDISETSQILLVGVLFLYLVPACVRTLWGALPCKDCRGPLVVQHHHHAPSFFEVWVPTLCIFYLMWSSSSFTMPTFSSSVVPPQNEIGNLQMRLENVKLGYIGAIQQLHSHREMTTYIPNTVILE